MLTTRVRILVVCFMSAVLSACSSSTPNAPTPPSTAQPSATVTLSQGTTATITMTGAPLRLAFDAVVEACRDTASCLPSSQPWTQFRVQVEGGGFEPLPLQRLGTDFRFQGSSGGYLFLVDSLRVQQPGEWVATVVVRKGLEF